ncbi:MAG: Crp/Fnr family transcriptional regulator [Bacteroidetes bacterium]|nr:MAG: Crp/Fnr family transcriptional regulator [Bacteroidota bacterium]
MHPLLEAGLSRHIQLTDEEKELLWQAVTLRKYRKRQYVLQAGDVCRYENFVVSGCLRAYYIDDAGTEHIIMFAVEDWWTSDLLSFLTQTPSKLNIDALEDSEVLQIEHSALEALYLKIPKLERFFRIMMQNAYIAQQQRILFNISKTAKERYLYFIEKYPKLEQRLPQHQIAAYLGITPEFLSQIRKQLSEG